MHDTCTVGTQPQPHATAAGWQLPLASSCCRRSRLLGPTHRAPAACSQGATEGWAAARDWVLPCGGVDLGWLQQRFGAAVVPVTDTAR